MKKRVVFLLFPAAALWFLNACSNDPLAIDSSSTKVSISYKNLDSLITASDSSDLQTKLLGWHVEIPEVIDYELGYCLGVGRVSDNTLTEQLYSFTHHPYIVRTQKHIARKFPDLPGKQKAITEGFRNIKTHLPDAKMPAHIVFMNSYFTSSAFCTEKDIAIGLERYLGAKTDVITELPNQEFPQYIRDGMEPEYMERDAAASWILTHILEGKEDLSAIEAIIHWGKVLYLTEAAFPDLEERIIVRYTQEDYDWALKNERDFWKFLVDQKMLFKKDATVLANMLNEAPFTAGLPEKGPARLGQFLGWRIVKSYMEQHDITVKQVLDLPYTELLSEYEID